MDRRNLQIVYWLTGAELGPELRAADCWQPPSDRDGWRLLLWRELVFAQPANGAYPIIGQISKRCPGGDAAVCISLRWVVDVTTTVAHVPHCVFHSYVCVAPHGLSPVPFSAYISVL